MKDKDKSESEYKQLGRVLLKFDNIDLTANSVIQKDMIVIGSTKK